MSKPAKKFIFCVHSHQPVGNFGWVFEEAYEKSYKPFFETVEKHPSIPVCCHFSGSLIDWLESNRPEFIEKLRKMGKRGQLEFLGGGYYEPIYGAIPKRDLAGQIQLMRKNSKRLFGQDPEGAWLTERVWDPDLVTPLRNAGVDFTILDDLHLEKAGVDSPVTGIYRAKEGSKTLDLFSSMKQLRYLMPFRKPGETIDFIRSAKSGPSDCFVFADDCEKFGLWPGTHQWVYGEKWLEKLLVLLESSTDIDVCTFSEFRKRVKPKKTVDIPHASYSEMMEWSGGRFYNFFKKYPESQYMRDRMWHVSEMLEKARAHHGKSPKWEKARAALYRAQCNCTYWHGVFGGLYLHHLRSAVFENLIQAEEILSGFSTSSRKAFSGARVEVQKLESGERWQIRQKDLVSFFNPRYGGALEELDTIPKSVNLMCNLQRHRETYHEAVLKKVSVAAEGTRQALSIHEMLGTKEKDLDKYLYYDPVRRLSFMDHFFEKPLSWDEFSKSVYAEAGNFIGSAYHVAEPGQKNAGVISFRKKGELVLAGKTYALTLAKTVSPAGDAAFQVGYSLKNESSNEISFTFGAEFNFSIGETAAMKGLEEKEVREWIFNDSWRGLSIRLAASESMGLLAAPVETVSESESGLERTYQELGILFQKNYVLRPKETKECFIELAVR